MPQHFLRLLFLGVALFTLLVSTNSAKANYCEENPYDPYKCIYQKLLDQGTINQLTPSGFTLDTTQGFNGFKMNTVNWKATIATLSDTQEKSVPMTDSSVNFYGCTKNDSITISGTSILKLEQYQSISSAQSTDTNTSATFELMTNSQFGTTNIKTDTNISYDINTQDSSSQTLSDTTEKTNSLSVNQKESINCGGKRISKSSYNGPYVFIFSQNADQITITDTKGSEDIKAFYDLYPETSSTPFTLYFKKDTATTTAMGVYMKNKNGGVCSFPVGPGFQNYQAYFGNTGDCGEYWNSKSSYWFSNSKAGWSGSCYSGSYKTKSGQWKALPYSNGAAYGMPNDMDMSQGFVLSNYCNDVISTEYQTVNPNLDAYLPWSALNPNKFDSDYDDEQNSQYHRVNFIYNAKNYSGLDADTTLNAYFMFEPDRPVYDLSVIDSKCQKLVTNWNTACGGGNNLQQIIVDQDNETFVKEFNEYVKTYDQKQSQVCQNDKGKWYINDEEEDCPES